MFNDMETDTLKPTIQNDDSDKGPIPTLKSLCEKVAGENLVEPRNAIQLLEIADSLVVHDFQKYSEDIVIRNPDYVFTVSSQAIASASPDILAYLENILDLRSSEPWSYRRLPTPTATFPATIYSEEDDSENEVQRTRDGHTKQSTSKNEIHQRPDSFLQPKDDPNHDIGKQVRALRNKLQQIEMLEAKQSSGQLLDDQQITKLQTRLALESELAELGVPVETSQLKASSSVQPDGKGNKRVELSKKQRRKNKQMATPVDIGSSFPGDEVEPKHTKDFLSIEISQTTKNMASLLNSKIRFIIRRKMP